MIIYKATNRTNGKVYIGLTTTTLRERMWKHKANSKSPRYEHIHFYRALRKYKEEDFTWEQIDSAATFEELKEKERNYIEENNSFKEGYNSTRGGEGIKGFTHSESTREKIRQCRTGYITSEETKQILSESMKGVHCGSNSVLSKLTDKDVITIKTALTENSMTQKELAVLFGVSKSTISLIKAGKRWGHIQVS